MSLAYSSICTSVCLHLSPPSGIAILSASVTLQNPVRLHACPAACRVQTCLLALCMHDFLTAFTSTCRNRYLSHCMPICMHFPLIKYISFIDLCFMCICLFVCLSACPSCLDISLLLHSICRLVTVFSVSLPKF
jgi:hypothetical protein